MTQVNMLEAKTNLSKLVEAVETGQEREIILARSGKPVARLVPIATVDVSKRLGIAEGEFGDVSPEELAKLDKEFEAKWAEALSKPLYPTYEAAQKAKRRKKSV